MTVLELIFIFTEHERLNDWKLVQVSQAASLTLLSDLGEPA